MKFFNWKSVLILSIIAGFVSCKTEVDLRAPYDDTPVVFGVLDQSADTQYFKINKSFIGEGDNFSYASIPDCTIFSSVSATVTEINSGTKYPLKEKYVKNLDDGIFYADSQKVYYFVPITTLNSDSKYKLDVKIYEGTSKEKTLTAQTDVVGEIPLDLTSLREDLTYVIDDDPEIEFSSKVGIKFNSPTKEMLFSVNFIFTYEEHKTDASVTERSIVFFLGEKTSKNPNELMDFYVTGEQFFSTIENDNHIKNTNINTVQKRVIKGFSYTIAAANQELTTYIALNKPSASIAQERPTYTNIEGGLGVFASRYNMVVDKSRFGTDFRLNKLSLQYLWDLGLLFCTDDSRYSASSNSGGPEDFYCP
jgi:hypothetical protein